MEKRRQKEVLTTWEWQTISIVTATCFSRVGCLLQNTLQPLSQSTSQTVTQSDNQTNTQSITQSWTIHTVSQSVNQWKSKFISQQGFQSKPATAGVSSAGYLIVCHWLLLSLQSAYHINVHSLHEESKWFQIEFYSLCQLFISVIYQQSNDLHLWSVTCDAYSFNTSCQISCFT